MDFILSTISSPRLVVRDADSTGGMSPVMLNLLIALMVLIFVSLLLIGALYFVRKIRQRRAIARQQLPYHNEKVLIPSSANHKRLTISTTRNSSVYIYDEKSSMMSSPSSPALSPVPEIRITFPDEEDHNGRRTSGRVLVVRVGETSVGLEPLENEEQLPAYEKEGRERFHSIDMDRIGGLKEKSEWS
jgi:hypothetical protein